MFQVCSHLGQPSLSLHGYNMVNVHQEHRDWQPHGWLDQPVVGQPVEVQGDDQEPDGHSSSGQFLASDVC